MSKSIANTKWVIAATGAAVLLGAWTQSDVRAQRMAEQTDQSANGTADECVNCQQRAGERPGRIMVPITGDPAVDGANLDAVQQIFAARQRRYMEEAEQRLREKQKVWQGTTAELHPRASDAQRESAAPFVELFQQDLPAPKVRREHFAAFFKEDSPDRCVGWRIRLRAAEEVEDGWLVDVEGGVHLLGQGAVVISHGTTDEIWHVSREGELTFVEGSPGEDEPAKVNARF